MANNSLTDWHIFRAMPEGTDYQELNNEAWRLRTSDRERSAQLAKEALRLAQQKKDLHAEMKAKLTLASYANFKLELKEAEKLLDEVTLKMRSNTPCEIEVRLLLQSCYLRFQQGSLDEALRIGKEMLALTNHKSLFDERAWVLTTIGIIHQRSGESGHALESYRKAEKLSMKIGDRAQISNIKMSIATAMAELGKDAESLEIFQEALNYRLAVGGDFHAGMILGNMAKVYQRLGDHPKALLRWTEAEELLRKAGGMPYWAQSAAGKADTLRSMGRLMEAEQQLEQVLAEASQLPPDILITPHVSMARIHLDAERWQKAILHLKEAEKLVDDTTNHSLQVEIHEGFYAAHRAMGQFEEALASHERMSFHTGRHLNEKSINRLAEWEMIYQMERLREKNELLNSQLKDLNAKLVETSSDRELQLTKIAKYDALIDEMMDRIPTDNSGRFKKLLSAIRKKGIDSVFEVMVHSRISKVHPSLTPSELQVCSMIISGWSSKEMADHSGTGLKNIEKHRGSIRRKTGIPRSVSLQVYLAGIAKAT